MKKGLSRESVSMLQKDDLPFGQLAEDTVKTSSGQVRWPVLALYMQLIAIRFWSKYMILLLRNCAKLY